MTCLSMFPKDEFNDHLGGPPLLTVRTNGTTPFRLVTHIGDVGHTLVVGPTGAGKSVLLSLIALQFRRYPDAQITFFDKGGSARAAVLAKCDSLTGMVGEFPELQGTMGRYYADASKEPAEVAQAIGEQYLPRFAGDSLPKSVSGQVLAVADKLDHLAGDRTPTLLASAPTDDFDEKSSYARALGKRMPANKCN